MNGSGFTVKSGATVAFDGRRSVAVGVLSGHSERHDYYDVLERQVLVYVHGADGESRVLQGVGDGCGNRD